MYEEKIMCGMGVESIYRWVLGGIRLNTSYEQQYTRVWTSFGLFFSFGCKYKLDE